MGQVPSGGAHERQPHTDVSLLFLPPFPSLKIKKLFFLKKSFLKLLRLFPLVNTWPKIPADHAQGPFQSSDAARVAVLVGNAADILQYLPILAGETTLFIGVGNQSLSKLYPMLSTNTNSFMLQEVSKLEMPLLSASDGEQALELRSRGPKPERWGICQVQLSDAGESPNRAEFW